MRIHGWQASEKNNTLHLTTPKALLWQDVQKQKSKTVMSRAGTKKIWQQENTQQQNNVGHLARGKGSLVGNIYSDGGKTTQVRGNQ